MTMSVNGSDKFHARMRSIDPSYGSQQHQRDMLERLDECHRRAPCVIEHEHEFKCYPDAVREEVTQWQIGIIRKRRIRP